MKTNALLLLLLVPAVLLLNMEGFVCHVTPSLNEWFSYTPSLKVKLTKKDSQINLDLALAEASSPLQRQISKGEGHSYSVILLVRVKRYPVTISGIFLGFCSLPFSFSMY